MLTAVALLAPGCYWMRYRAIARTHKDLMVRFAEDARDAYLSKTVRLQPSDITRLEYPLKRAREFERSVRPRRPRSMVLATLARLTDGYAALVRYLDSVRGRPPDEASRRRVVSLTGKVVEIGGELQRQLDSKQP